MRFNKQELVDFLQFIVWVCVVVVMVALTIYIVAGIVYMVKSLFSW